MRTLDKNKQRLWAVDSTGTTDVVDSNGYKTGEVVRTYGTPYQILLMLTPSKSDVKPDTMGVDKSYDMTSVSMIDIPIDSLLFYKSPVQPYDTSYDFRVVEKRKSLNSYYYGFRSRT